MAQKRKHKRAFESVTDLAADSGLVSLPLGDITIYLREQADQQPNPWTFLTVLGKQLGASKSQLLFFRAADSQRQASLRFARIVQRTGSVKTSWFDKLVAACNRGDTHAQLVAAKRIFAGMYRLDRGRFLLKAARDYPAMLAQIKTWKSELHAKAVRKVGRRKADTTPERPTLAACVRPEVASERVG